MMKNLTELDDSILLWEELSTNEQEQLKGGANLSFNLETTSLEIPDNVGVVGLYLDGSVPSLLTGDIDNGVINAHVILKDDLGQLGISPQILISWELS